MKELVRIVPLIKHHKLKKKHPWKQSHLEHIIHMPEFNLITWNESQKRKFPYGLAVSQNEEKRMQRNVGLESLLHETTLPSFGP
jgi:hypothetical protein